jgi:hypothetical protein
MKAKTVDTIETREERAIRGEDTDVAPETTPEQAAALEKAFKQGSEEAEADGGDKTRPCPECGIPNPVNRITCDVCGNRMDAYKQPKRGGGNMEELRKDLFESNKRLKTARTVGDTKLESNLLRKIKGFVAKSKGTFGVGKDGMAVQVKSTKEAKPKAPPKPKKEAVKRNCPCCGEATKNGSYFLMGHDGRTHSIILKLERAEIKPSQVKAVVIKMWEAWKKGGKKLSMKECAQKVAGE